MPAFGPALYESPQTLPASSRFTDDIESIPISLAGAKSLLLLILFQPSASASPNNTVELDVQWSADGSEWFSTSVIRVAGTTLATISQDTVALKRFRFQVSQLTTSEKWPLLFDTGGMAFARVRAREVGDATNRGSVMVMWQTGPAAYPGAFAPMSVESPVGGNIVGPTSSTDNALARFDGTTGRVIQDSGAILSDANVLSGITMAASLLTGPAITSVKITGTVSESAGALANVTGLSFALTSGRYYDYLFFIRYQTAATTTGIQFSMDYTGTFTYHTGKVDVMTSMTGTAGTVQSRGYRADDIGSATTNVDAATSDMYATITGKILPTSSATLIVRFMTEVGTSQVDVLAGSSGLLFDMGT